METDRSYDARIQNDRFLEHTKKSKDPKAARDRKIKRGKLTRQKIRQKFRQKIRKNKMEEMK